ncbi:MAG: ABC transporter ATP-binding protein [Bacteroidota bacterium]
MKAEESYVINISDLSIRYGMNDILRNIHLSISEGEFIGIVGLSGSGKTSFLNAIAGFIPYTGNISVQGKIGYMSQNYGIFPWMKVKDNIGFGIEGRNSQQKERRISELLKEIDMELLGNRYPSELSGGQIQRVALAQTLASDPQIILADEPYSALDQHTRGRMQEWLLTILSSRKKTTLFVTHNIEEAVFLCDKIIVIKDGTFAYTFHIPFTSPRKQSLKFEPEFNLLQKNILESLSRSR